MLRKQLKQFDIPDEPGVYLFKSGRKVLYVGKAASVRDRVRSYFSSDLGFARSPAIVRMVEEARSVSHQKTNSVLEALILEANLIKKLQPPYNVDEKDNKSFNYLVITKDDFPRVLIVRGRELFNPLKAESWQLKATFGPFPQGGSLKEALKIVRKIFPYADKCTAGSGKPCFNRQIGLCPGVCTGEITREEYAQTIRNIKDLFSGNFHGLKRRLTHEMRSASKSEHFEEAAKLRRQIAALEHVRDVSLIRDESRISSGGSVRIEAFDVAHTAGHETVAVMTVVNNGEKISGAYRKFKIKNATNDDIAALKEALSRRLNHSEWPLPRVFVVDGGKAQVRAAEKVLKSAGVLIPVVGVVKDEFHRPKQLIGDKRAIEAYEKDILLANSEAHRFAITWHRKRRRKGLTL